MQLGQRALQELRDEQAVEAADNRKIAVAAGVADNHRMVEIAEAADNHTVAAQAVDSQIADSHIVVEAESNFAVVVDMQEQAEGRVLQAVVVDMSDETFHCPSH